MRARYFWAGLGVLVAATAAHAADHGTWGQLKEVTHPQPAAKAVVVAVTFALGDHGAVGGEEARIWLNPGGIFLERNTEVSFAVTGAITGTLYLTRRNMTAKGVTPGADPQYDPETLWTHETFHFRLEGTIAPEVPVVGGRTGIYEGRGEGGIAGIDEDGACMWEAAMVGQGSGELRGSKLDASLARDFYTAGPIPAEGHILVPRPR